jgi:hypothetical protein
MHKQRPGQILRYIRYIAKWISLPFVLIGVFIFIIQYLPSFIGKGTAFWIFIIAAMFWALDTLFGTLDGINKIGKEIDKHRQN